MKTKLSGEKVLQRAILRKNLLFVNVFFFGVIAFFTIACYQFVDLMPNRLLIISVFTVLLIGLGLFFYGFWLRNHLKSHKQLAYFSSIYLLLVSINTFLASNISYTADQVEGEIVETVNYFAFTLTAYLIIVAILSLVMFILASPKALNKEIRTVNAYVWYSLLGLAIVAVVYIILMVIMNKVFTHPGTVKEAYEFFIISVGFGMFGTSIPIIVNRPTAKWVEEKEK